MPTVYIYSVFQKKSSPHKTFWNIFTSVKSFCVKSCKFVGNSYPHVCQFLCIYLNISSNGIYFSTSTHHFHRVKLWVLNADASWARTQLYPDKEWKLSTVKKVCSRVDRTGSTILRKPDRGTGRPATASACTVCRYKTIFPLLGTTKLLNNVSKMFNSKKVRQLLIVYNYRTLRHMMRKNDVVSEKLHFHFLGE